MSGFSFNISVTAEASDFKSGVQLGFANTIGVDPGGTQGTRPPLLGLGDANVLCPPLFLSLC